VTAGAGSGDDSAGSAADPGKVKEAWITSARFDEKYVPLISPNDKPATHLNTETLAKFGRKCQYYFDPVSKRIWSNQSNPVREAAK
jgi:hypothetical protein